MKIFRRSQDLGACAIPGRLATILLVATAAGGTIWTASSSRAAPAQGSATSVTTPAWQVQPGSSIGFHTSWSGTGVTGAFRTWTADIHFDPDKLERSSVRVSVDPASAATDHNEVDAQLGGEDWFNVAKFPQVAFVADRFERIDADHFRASGTLTMKGMSQPLSFPFTLKVTGDQATMEAEIGLNRIQFGLGTGEYSDGTTIPVDVAVDVKLTAKKQG